MNRQDITQQGGNNFERGTQTNPRYRGYRQIHFTAGDEEQFRESVPRINPSSDGRKVKAIRLARALQPRKQLAWYGRCNARSRDNTFKYLFHGFKKGICVQIRDGKLRSFQPFSKYNYYQDWGDKLKPSRLTMEKLLKQCQELSGRTYNRKKVQRDQRQWISNGFLLRYENPPREGDSNVAILEDMLQSLCNERDVPDLEFFLNRHDFPRLRKDLKNPFVQYIGPSAKVTHYGGKSYCPILSMCSGDDYADVPVPTWEDWLRVSCGREFGSTYVNRETKDYKVSDLKWEDKIPKAVFRGASTGAGTSIESNTRMKLAAMSLRDERLDAGITSFNYRPRVVSYDDHSAYVDVPAEHSPLEVVEKLTPYEQSQYKYVVNVDGHACAFRLVSELGYGSVILLAEGHLKLWVKDALVDGVHYVGIKPDLSDLSEKLDWCEQHPEECKEIARNALNFFNKHCTRDAMLDYLQSILVKLKHQVGDYKYNDVSATDVMASLEKRIISEKRGEVEITEGEIVRETRSTKVVRTEKGILKVSKKPEKHQEARHDVFVAIVLEELRQEQVARCLESSTDRSLWIKVPGPTLLELAKSGISLPDLRDICLQVCGVLQSLQESCMFVHNDLYPWNIVCSDFRGKISTYQTKRGCWESSGKLHLTLVDFGKSSVVHNGMYFGRIRPFEYSSIRDVVTLLVSLSNVLLEQHMSKPELSFVFAMLSFLSETAPEYTGGRFKTVKDIRSFTTRAKKYTEMIYSCKGTLEQKEPADLLSHLGLATITNPPSSLLQDSLSEDLFVDRQELANLPSRAAGYSTVARKTIEVISQLIMGVNADTDGSV